MCRHYRWRHDFWRIQPGGMYMGRREFWAWVAQANQEQQEKKTSPHSWRGTENDPAWIAMREKRARLMGRDR